MSSTWWKASCRQRTTQWWMPSPSSTKRLKTQSNFQTILVTIVRLDITVKLVRGQYLCNLLATSARARKFGQENHMAPGDQPDALKDLKPAEIAAVSLVLPDVQVFPQGQGLRMKGHSISFPQELGQDDVISHLPRLPANLCLVYIKGHPAKCFMSAGTRSGMPSSASRTATHTTPHSAWPGCSWHLPYQWSSRSARVSASTHMSYQTGAQ